MFRLFHLSKPSRPAHDVVKFYFPAFKGDTRQCPVKTLRTYEQHTEGLGTNINRVRPKVSSSYPWLASISYCSSSSKRERCLKSSLQKAGINTSMFKTLNMASLKYKAAMAVITVEEILQASDRSGNMFFKSSLMA